jgi:CRP/FNR family cyclic AMP-dependent transcriptional regulator
MASFSPDAFLSNIDGGKTIFAVEADKVIFSQGSPADSVYFLKSGKMKLSVTSDQGKEAVVAILGPDEFFGEGCLTGQTIRMASAVAIEKSLVLKIPKAETVRVLRDEPSFSAMFISHLLARNARIEEDLIDQLFNSSEKRLARLLLLMANFGKENAPQPIVGRITQATLAHMIGTTRARVSFFMNKFRKLGLIDYNGEIRVHPALLNVLLHDKPHLHRSGDTGDNNDEKS